jgi:hypothetical protein
MRRQRNIAGLTWKCITLWSFKLTHCRTPSENILEAGAEAEILVKNETAPIRSDHEERATTATAEEMQNVHEYLGSVDPDLLQTLKNLGIDF